ncbi:hypothetical protein K438DRAFT_2079307 [Mycena galopus ATCC 62051]|nr:hypothetical protein K438DRAFT_2079307 [Mycena galopus ATCC 62051]
MDLHRLLNAEEVSNRLTRVLGVSELLNPDDIPVDALPLINELATFSENNSLLVPHNIHNHLHVALQHLRGVNFPRTNPILPPPSNDAPLPSNFIFESSTQHSQKETNIKINRETTLDVLYRYPVDALLEYPETSSTGSIGHLFHMDPKNWTNPILNVVYSRGEPSGQTLPGKEVFVNILTHAVTGEKVPCVMRHTTCQGSKVCPYGDLDVLSLPHTSATRADIKERLQNDRYLRLESTSPTKDVFLRTVAYLAAIQRMGCRRPLTEETFLLASEQEERETRELYLQQIQRGYRSKEGICEGRLVFGNDDDLNCAYICKDHFKDSSVDNGAYHIDYIEAVLTGDLEEAARIEDAAQELGYGPRLECTTVSNCSSQKAYCPVPHCDSNGALVQPVLDRLPCSSKFRVYQPVEEVRESCPFILIVTTGDHPHPVPLPIKTPPQVRSKIMSLLDEMADDLADLTPRRFLRHPIVKAFLIEKLPSSYIKHARGLHYPFGTDWAGVLNLKAHQDAKLPVASHYIRRVLAIEVDPSDPHLEDEDDDGPVEDNRLRIIICMTPDASRRLLSSGRYLQSDIAFCRIAGFKEFEVAGMERDSNTSIIYLRIFINRMCALAHQHVFQEIEAIVYEDTGSHLKWHHIHASSPTEGLDSMILSWVGDQHRGQAKGLGLHLQKLASKLPPKKDLYEPNRTIQDLSPYEHLHRIFRVCVVHYFRLVKLCATTEHVRWLMRSLVCMTHSDWDGALQMINEDGGKAAQDWLQNKLSSGFVFEGICWEKSFIPRTIWEAGDSNSNLIETVHRDANREGVHCTLVGGLKKGQQFDNMKMKTLEVGAFGFSTRLV